jgi:4-amino-4-deoxy-L-arabinose transferase-like glycosyltransferase
MEHSAIARHLLAGLGFSFGSFEYFGPSSVQSPTYPLLLAALFAIFGSDSAAAYAVALTINSILAVPAVIGITLMTRSMGGSRSEALVAAALLAIWPTQIYAATHAQVVAFVTTCLIWMVVLFQRAAREGEWRMWLAYSLVASIASLTEPTLLIISFLSGLWMLLKAPMVLRVRLRNAALLAGTALLVMGPWTLRNWSVHGTFVPVKSSFWVNVWKGANDYATGTDRLKMPEALRQQIGTQFLALDDAELRGPAADPRHQYDALSADQLRELTGKSEVERERIFRRYATKWILSHPRRYGELCLMRLYKTLWIDWDNPKSHNAAYVGSRVIILLLSVSGLIVAISRRWHLLYPLALVGSCLLIYTLTLTAARFAIPVEPVLLALGSATFGWTQRKLVAERCGAD